MIQPEDAEIAAALGILQSPPEDRSQLLSTSSGNDTNSASIRFDARQIENVLRQLARYRDELKLEKQLDSEQSTGTIGHFEILHELGRGGCGVVFLARDPELGRLVALKVPHPAALVSPELQRRFVTEARAAAVLEHPNIIRVYEVGCTGPISWIASEYCPGSTLQSFLERSQTRIAPRDAAKLIQQLATAIDYAHRRGILHRDLKPANVLLLHHPNSLPESPATEISLQECEPKLTDFGLAKILNDAQDATQTQMPLGTPAYMSPEQISGNGSQIGVASDIYSMGIILYELLTGVPAFRGSTRTDTWQQILQDDPKPITLFRKDVPRDLQAIVRHATEKTPSQRYATAAALAGDLQRFLAGEPTLARPLSQLTRGIRWMRRHPGVTGVLSVIALALMLLIAGGLWHLHKIEEELRINNELRATGQTQLDELRYIAYLRSLDVANDSLNQAKLDAGLAALHEAEAKPGEPDYRNFVWHHLWNRCHHEVFQLQHQRTVSALAYSPDGNFIASGGHDGRILICDAKNGTILHSLEGHDGHINDVVFHGDRLLTAADDGKVLTWNYLEGTRTNSLKCHEGDILCMAMHPTEPWLATGGVDMVLRLWDVNTQKLLKEFVGEPHWLRGVGFSPDGKQLLSTGHEQRLRCWDIASGELAWISDRVNGKLHALAIHTSANTVFVGGHSGIVYEHRLSDGAVVDQIATDLTWIRGLAYNKTKKHLAVCANTGRIRIWKVSKPSTEPPEFDFPAHNAPIWSVAFAPDGEFFATGCSGSLLKVWRNDTDSQNGCRIWDLGKLQNARDVRVDFATGKVVVITSDAWVEVNLREYRKNEPVAHEIAYLDHARIHDRLDLVGLGRVNQPFRRLNGFEHREENLSSLGFTIGPDDKVAWTPDGQRLWVFGREQNLRLWNIAQERIEKEYTVKSTDSPRSLVLSPNGRFATLHFNDPRRVYLLDLEQGNCLWESLSNKANPVFSQDSKQLAIGFSEETIKIYDLEKQSVTWQLAGKASELSALAFTPDNRMLAAGYMDNRVQIWDLRTGTMILEIPTELGTPYAIFLSPDQRQMLVVLHHRGRHKLCYFADKTKLHP